MKPAETKVKMERITFVRADDDESRPYPIDRSEVPAWIQDDAIMARLIDGLQILDESTGKWYGAVNMSDNRTQSGIIKAEKLNG